MQLSDFAVILLRQNVLPAKGTFSITQDREGKVIQVKKLENSPYKSLYCWYNCKAHSIEHGGKVVFGWALDFQNKIFQAQHHAIWMNEEGEYIDITPNSKGETTFLVDGRAPFCYETYRHPPNFYYDPSNDLIRWGDIEQGELMSFYFIGRPESKNDRYIIELLGDHR
jgi:hypothetical protein